MKNRDYLVSMDQKFKDCHLNKATRKRLKWLKSNIHNLRRLKKINNAIKGLCRKKFCGFSVQELK